MYWLAARAPNRSAYWVEAGYSNQKMNSYLLRHYQVTGSTGGKGFVTFVPFVVTQAAAQADTQADPQRGAEEGEDSVAGDSLDRANESPQ